MRLSCAFATSLRTPEHVAVAEALGFHRAWCYDSPGVYPDVWMTLARCAERTSRIGLGPAVLVPSLRHLAVNASALLTLESLAPGRTAAAIGSGFTGRRVFGQKPQRWAEVASYIESLRALLAGDSAVVDGAAVALLQREGFGVPRPLSIPLFVGADGPKGFAVARRLGDGLVRQSRPREREDWPWLAHIVFGTVIEVGEDPASDRVLEAVGPCIAAGYHAAYERSRDEVDRLPGGVEWRRRIEMVPPERRHLELYRGHLHELMEDERATVAGAAALFPKLSFTGSAEQLRARAREYELLGVDELIWQPAGPHVADELQRMRDALAPFVSS